MSHTNLLPRMMTDSQKDSVGPGASLGIAHSTSQQALQHAAYEVNSTPYPASMRTRS